jgi:hypothetical protein
LDVRNNGAFPLDLVCPEHLNVQSPTSLPDSKWNQAKRLQTNEIKHHALEWINLNLPSRAAENLLYENY